MTIQYQGSGTPVSPQKLQQSYEELGCAKETLWALLTVETKGFGYLPDRRPKILFERVVFHQRTNGLHDSHPDISSPTPGGYLGGAAEYQRLAAAVQLDELAALSSTSWGMGQIMGFNATDLHYADVHAMIAAFVDSEDAQLDGVCRFINSKHLSSALRDNNWQRIASGYNGKDYARNQYDRKLLDAHDQYVQDGCPDVVLRAAQAYLTYLDYAPNGVDGIQGRNTLAALHRFEHHEGLPENDTIDAGTVAALRQAYQRAPH